MSREFLKAVENKVLRQRPSWRVDAAKVNPLCDSVLVIADHSIFPSGIIYIFFFLSSDIVLTHGTLACTFLTYK